MKTGINGWVNGKSLLYAIFVSLVSSIILVGVIYSHFAEEIFLRNNQMLDTSMQEVNNNLALLACYPDGQDRILNFTTEKNDDVVSYTYDWGLYRVLGVKLHHGKYAMQKFGLYGFSFDKNARAVSISNSNRKLNLSGNCKINGDVTIPFGFYTEKNLGSDRGRPTVNGAKKMATGSIDVGENELLARIGKMKSNLFDSVIAYVPRQKISNPFSHRTCVLKSDVMKLDNDTFSGNIRIEATRKIFISKNCSLENVICVAPQIEIEKGFTGQAQFFATDTLLLNEDCHMSYPSCAVVLGNSKNSALILMDKVKFGGSIVLIKKEQGSGLIIIQKGAEVTGEILTNSYLQLEGKVTGMVMADKFYLNTGAAVYENYLSGAEIDVKSLPGEFVSGNKKGSSKKQMKLITWIE